jgi:hypothetical protein
VDTSCVATVCVYFLYAVVKYKRKHSDTTSVHYKKSDPVDADNKKYYWGDTAYIVYLLKNSNFAVCAERIIAMSTLRCTFV